MRRKANPCWSRPATDFLPPSAASTPRHCGQVLTSPTTYAPITAMPKRLWYPQPLTKGRNLSLKRRNPSLRVKLAQLIDRTAVCPNTIPLTTIPLIAIYEESPCPTVNNSQRRLCFSRPWALARVCNSCKCRRARRRSTAHGDRGAGRSRRHAGPAAAGRAVVACLRYCRHFRM